LVKTEGPSHEKAHFGSPDDSSLLSLGRSDSVKAELGSKRGLGVGGNAGLVEKLWVRR